MTTVAPASALAERRPKRADAARNFDALVAAGRAAFAESGSDASLEDIARRAGVGIGTLYRNFPTRDDLIETLYLGEVDALAASALEVASLEPWDALRAWLDRFVSYVGTKHALLDGLNRESSVLTQCRHIMLSAGEPLLSRAQQAGAVDPDITISDVVKLVSGVAAVASYDSPAQRERVLNLAINAIRR
ncbi:MAG TPA: TetR/AcrR family transcriptional regulator [Microbacterium sp.]|uniref:TetR/AcrR family transcriptional regulator n=1 Tax=Microbacterium arabinogalactanolyticum TaxID=69365 RepID=UPI00255378A9|nr:TetR/AcrR family transcriptional regulator [Microbacterium arabinogalactanolyticum]GLC84989.1 TetR family transcriptional regulator [Microbacterium arabinogalactanolyticum]HWU28844.1 TetR/AcrR family transcriptional regulator [Microbacterium sp.]